MVVTIMKTMLLKRHLLANRFSLLILSTVAIIFFGCNGSRLCTSVEKSRTTSQDNIVDVVVIEKDCGATTPTSTHIFIVPTQENVEKFTAIFIADNTKGVKVSWIRPKKLLIEYSEARIFNFTNFWSSKKVKRFKYEVEIILGEFNSGK